MSVSIGKRHAASTIQNHTHHHHEILFCGANRFVISALVICWGILLRTVYRFALSNVCFWYGTGDRERIIHLAKMAAAAPFAIFANFANNRCESSLTPPTIHTQPAENESVFATLLPISPIRYALTTATF